MRRGLRGLRNGDTTVQKVSVQKIEKALVEGDVYIRELGIGPAAKGEDCGAVQRDCATWRVGKWVRQRFKRIIWVTGSG